MPPYSTPPGAAGTADLPWRVIGLLNVFRLLVPMVLILVFFFNAPDRSVGTVHPGLFLGISVAYFTFGLICIQPIQNRWPSAHWMALFPLTVDAVAITLLIHASGGVSSGLATLLFLPVGATAAIVQPRLALLATALIAIGLLFETTISTLSGVTQGADFLVAGLTGASLFAITLIALPLANRLR
jgi:two-component system sensor histidine kinase PilS (NtrC family)